MSTTLASSSTTETRDLDARVVAALRALSVDMVETANSGHPGAPMGLAPLVWTLYSRHLRHDPADPAWPDRDRFVLSCGHASALLYSVLHLTGYDLDVDDLRAFRQRGSRTPGHPEVHETPGVEATTGPLGQGVANGVGFALAERLVAERTARPGVPSLINHRTWVLASDGDLMEGIAAEACSLAGQLSLGNLVILWDDNEITLDGPAAWSFDREDVVTRFSAYGFRTLEVEDGEDLEEIDRVLTEAAKSDGRPTFVRVRTVIGRGAPTKQGTSAAHGSPLGSAEAAGAKGAWGWTSPPFEVPTEVREHADLRARGEQLRLDWLRLLGEFGSSYPEVAADLRRCQHRRLPLDWDALLPAYVDEDDEEVRWEATRATSGAVLQRLAAALPELVGGSADLAGSNKTTIPGDAVDARSFAGRNINYGVREHAMAGIANGLALHGGVRPFIGTFLTFSDYMRGSMRIAALSGTCVIYVLTHDSIGLGEDGPTHQSVEHVAALRAIPGLEVVRPADARETVAAWRHAVERTDGPTAIILSRQDLPALPGTSVRPPEAGAYVVVDHDDPDVVLLGTGSELQHCVGAAAVLAEDGIGARVVSVPCLDRLHESADDARRTLLGEDVPVLSVEAGVRFGWGEVADAHVSIDRFGASAPGD